MTFAFVICGALRLARFNVQAQKPVGRVVEALFCRAADSGRRGAYRVDCAFLEDPDCHAGRVAAVVSAVGFTAFLMISTVRYHNFKELGIFSRRPACRLVAAAMMIALIFVLRSRCSCFWRSFTLLPGPSRNCPGCAKAADSR